MESKPHFEDSRAYGGLALGLTFGGAALLAAPSIVGGLAALCGLPIMFSGLYLIVRLFK